ncbi:MAG: DUF4345 domain-containing protein [Gammaproteobacteria bacterium]|nr:DUF4345 domain-containing protein [Gammaproteobacteria bacterium]
MMMTKFQKIVLGLAGFTAFAIGSFITLAPYAFYASYGIALDSDPNLLSELRGPGANLAALGAVVMAGLFVRSLTNISIAIALVIFLAFPVGRIIGIVADGMPSESVLAALAIEVIVGMLLLVAFGKRSEPSTLAKPASY